MRVGIVGPWHPQDAVDMLTLRLVQKPLAESLGAEVVLVVGQGRARFAWPVPVIDIARLGGERVDALLVFGELGCGPGAGGAVPAGVWLPALALAQARGIPVVSHGARLIGDLTVLGADLQDALESFGIEAGPSRALHCATTPVAALIEQHPGRREAEVLIHASPALLAGPEPLGIHEGARWVSLRPGRGDRLVGIPAAMDTLLWDDADEVVLALAGAQAVVTDDPAVAAIAHSLGTLARDAAGEHYTSDPADLCRAHWARTLERSKASERPDLGLFNVIVRSLDRIAASASSPSRTVAEAVAVRGTDDAARAQEEARATRARADRWRSDYYQLRQRRSVKLALRLAELRRRWSRGGVRGLLRVARRALAAKLGRPSGGDAAAAGTAGRSGVKGTEARAWVEASVLGSRREAGPLVSIVVLTRDGLEHVRRLLPALDATAYRTFEVIVVDNGSRSETRRFLEEWSTDLPFQVLRNEHNASFGDGNDQAAVVARGDYLLLLNDDVAPIEPGWLGSLVDAAESTGAGAVGTRLVYPDGRSTDNAGDSSPPPLSLQHAGIYFENWGDGVPRPRHFGAREDPTDERFRDCFEVPAATAACLLVRREAYDHVGGFSPGYDYGLEDVDLCLKLRAAGFRIVIEGRTALWHYEFGTQNSRGADDKRQRRARNRTVFADRWGPRIHRQVLIDRILGAEEWSRSRLHVVITVSRLDERRRHGDWYSAHELGHALEQFGWRITYVERHQDHWYDLDRDVDVVVALIDSFDLSRVADHIVTVAWVRNWTERWVGHAWFDDFDIVFASSSVSAEIIRASSAQVPVLLPLATDPLRFTPAAATPEDRCDVVFVGSYWGEYRPVAQVLAALAGEYDVRLYGRGWEAVPEVSGLHRGAVEYERLPSILASASLVLDDTASPTKPYEAVNTRVFDALAAGSLIVSDNPGGISELFRTPLPSWDEPEQAVGLARTLLSDSTRREELQRLARDEVLEHHAYAHRAEVFRDALLRWADSPRVDVLVGVPDRRVEHRWGDTHFARAVQKQFRRVGVQSRLARLPDWTGASTATADVVLHLFGLSTYEPRSGQLSVLWNISHPERVEPSACEAYDLVLVASDAFAAELATQIDRPVHVVHQATDPERFRPLPNGPLHDLLFVGNSRKIRRRIIDDLLPTDLDLAVYGWGWTPDLIDPALVRGDHVDNRQLAGYYAAASIVLNDHWDDMRRCGFVSNRLYDALAAGAFVISDEVEGLDALFDGGVVTYRNRDELRRLVDHYLQHPGEREEVARRGRDTVLDRHSFSRRVGQIVTLLRDQSQPALVLGGLIQWPELAVVPAGERPQRSF